MKLKYFAIIILIIGFVFAAGCSTYTPINTRISDGYQLGVMDLNDNPQWYYRVWVGDSTEPVVSGYNSGNGLYSFPADTTGTVKMGVIFQEPTTGKYRFSDPDSRNLIQQTISFEPEKEIYLIYNIDSKMGIVTDDFNYDLTPPPLPTTITPTKAITQEPTKTSGITAPPTVTKTPTKVPTSTITRGQENALKSAKNYIRVMGFSREGLIKQLEFEKYTHAEAVYGADNCGADWNKEAVECAENYLNVMSFSRDGLRNQLDYEGFTSSQIDYALRIVYP